MERGCYGTVMGNELVHVRRLQQCRMRSEHVRCAVAALVWFDAQHQHSGA